MSLDRIAHARLLYEVISLQTRPSDAEGALAGGWDLEISVVVLTARDLCAVLTQFVELAISAGEVADWADFLEVRDDVDFDDGLLKEAIHELANPVLHGSLTTPRAHTLLKRFSGLA